LILSHGSINDLRVEAAIVNASEITCVKPFVTVTIKLEESLVSYGLSLSVHVALKIQAVRKVVITLRPTKNSSKLTEASPSVSKYAMRAYAIRVIPVSLIDYICLLFGDVQTVFLESHEKLLRIDFAIAIVGVEGGEGLSETTD
jgi:hypothetical protein